MLQQRVHDLTVQKLKFAHVRGNLEIGKPVHDPVEYLARRPHDRALFAVRAGAGDNLVPLFPQFHEIGDQFGRVLQVDRQHHQNRVAGGVFQAVEGGPEDPEIPGVHDDFDRRVGGGDGFQDFDGAVVRGVIDENMLQRIARKVVGKDLLHRLVALRDVVFFVVTWGYD